MVTEYFSPETAIGRIQEKSYTGLDFPLFIATRGTLQTIELLEEDLPTIPYLGETVEITNPAVKIVVAKGCPGQAGNNVRFYKPRDESEETPSINITIGDLCSKCRYGRKCPSSLARLGPFSAKIDHLIGEPVSIWIDQFQRGFFTRGFEI